MVIECINVHKSYKEIKALNNLNLSIEKGEIYGLLGPNGAGKSTLINIFSSLLQHDSGIIKIQGATIPNEFNKIKKHLGFVPQDLAIYEDLTAYENVAFFASLYGLKGKRRKEKVLQALEFVGLIDRKNNFAKTFSGGMKRRLNIACGICHEPDIIFFDEPTVGIDPQSRNHILNSIIKLKQKGNTIIYTTHYMEEAQGICDNISIIDHGKIIAEGTIDQLINSVTEFELLYIEIKKESTTIIDKDKLMEISGVKSIKLEKNGLSITYDENDDILELLITKLKKMKVKVVKIESRRPNLEDVFLTLTGRNLRD